MSSRPVERITTSSHAIEGDGMQIRRPFPVAGLDHFDPFLLLDHFGPQDVAPGEARGTSPHPHRGFETVTYVIEGEFEHRDSAGHAGSLTPGAVQWMTAGAGVVHSEQPSRRLMTEGGRLNGLQLWVNLPRADKLMAPRYQELSPDKIPTATSPDGLVRVRVIAGEALGVAAAIDTRTPILYLHFTLQPGATVEQAVPEGYNAFAYVLAGTGLFGPERRAAGADEAVFFQDAAAGAGAGSHVMMGAPEGGPVDVLLLAGQPLGEPVARYGPFVMNTPEEIMQAIDDYQRGRFAPMA